MKRIIRSSITKTIAFLLVLTCVAAVAVVGTDLVNNLIRNKYAYSFDRGFEYSRGYMYDVEDMNLALRQSSAKDAANYLDSLGYTYYSIVGEVENYGNYSVEQIQELPYWLRWEKIVEPIEPISMELFPGFAHNTEDAALEDTYSNEAESPTVVVYDENVQSEVSLRWVEEPDSTILQIIYVDGKAYYAEVPIRYMAVDSFGSFLDPHDYRYRDDGAWVYGTSADPVSGTYETYAYYDSRRYDRSPTNDWEGSWTIYIGMSYDHYNDIHVQWNISRQSTINHLYILGGVAVLALLLWIYLLWVCGRRKEDEEVHMLLIDQAFVEFTAVIGMFLTFALGYFCIIFIDVGIDIQELYFPIAAAAAVGAAAAFVITTQSLVRNLKNSTFVSRMLSWRIMKFLWKWAVVMLGWAWQIAGSVLRLAWKWLGRIGRSIRRFFSFVCGNRISMIIMVIFGIYSLAVIFFTGIDMIPMAFAILLAVEILVYRWLAQLDIIQRGIKEIRGGNTDYKIEGCTSPVMIDAAENLNSINEGMKISVEREVKAQRMKSELITNVSHDLKTPLTSIISYADLLTAMELSPREANDYAKIIKQKGDRLKKLTADLFDISRAESGNENVDMERLDMALLLRQSMAELNNEIEKSGLTFVSDIPEKEIFITADGKKLSRVFENLIINALKYSMSGTRVYVSLKKTDGKAVAEIKNISAVPMNFDPTEITERFVRGDQSRTTEGSGLGLAIARSYTELCGGKLEIAVDGDLFKATVKFRLE